MEEEPEKLHQVMDTLEVDREEAMVVEAVVEEATGEAKEEEIQLARVGTQHSQPSNGPSVNSTMIEEAVIGLTLARESTSAACALGRVIY